MEKALINIKRLLIIITIIVLSIFLFFLLTACNTTDRTNLWKNQFDSSLPNLQNAGTSKEQANSDGWYQTMNDTFDTGLSSNWGNVQNHLRKEEYWCASQIEEDKVNGLIKVHAKHDSNHHCTFNCGAEGKSCNVTSGIITCDIVDGKRVPKFEQAFGYFECRVQFPNSDGMWSAFWLQCNSINQVGNKGEDGSEIDIYESSFFRKRSKVGNCIHFDGYTDKYHRSHGGVHDTKKDLYDGFHTFALKWTPNEYVFFCDNEAVWATDFGNVCKVPCFLMLTNEIRHPGTYGPYGQKLKDFTGGDFLIDYVKVYQNINFLSYIKSPADFA